MDDNALAERRTTVRHSLHIIGTAHVLYRRGIAQRPGDREPVDHKTIRVETVNISGGGLMLTFDAEISSGDVLQMTFNHPETKKELFLEGQIQWMHRNTTNLLGRYCAGVSFRNTPEDNIRSLVDYAVRIAVPSGRKQY
jgi:c-di-GMP-binding flagellar brake protein YcgR